jgi:hypothetical protein
LSNRRKPRSAAAARAYQDNLKCGHCPGRWRKHGPNGPGVYHHAGCPVLTAAVDPGPDARRAAAAASEATGIPVIHASHVSLTAQRTAGPAETVATGPRADAIVQRFITRMRAADMDFCPHIDPDSPPSAQDGAAWQACEPDRLICPACLLASQQRLIGTREDDTCDSCGQVATVASAGTPPMFAMAVRCDLVTLYFGLCRPCHAADQAAA